VLVEAGVGKVNAARTTQILIDNFEVDAIINVGFSMFITSSLSLSKYCPTLLIYPFGCPNAVISKSCC